MQPWVVLAANELQGATVQPGDQKRALAGIEVPIDICGCQPLRSRPDGESRAARILALDGEKPLGDGQSVRQRDAAETLRREPLGEPTQWTERRSTTKIRVSLGGIAGGRPAGP